MVAFGLRKSCPRCPSLRLAVCSSLMILKMVKAGLRPSLVHHLQRQQSSIKHWTSATDQLLYAQAVPIVPGAAVAIDDEALKHGMLRFPV